MNRTWKNNSGSSTGFVYFNTNNSGQNQSNQNSLDTPEFLSFGYDTSPGGSPHGNNFSPSNFSSPRNHYSRKSPRQRGGRNQYYSPVKPTGNKFWRRSSGLTGSADKNVSNTSNYFYENQHNFNTRNQTNKQRKSFDQSTPNQSFSAASFYDPDCLRDPWAELEKKLAEDRKEDSDGLMKLKSSQMPGQSADIEVKEASSGDSESEDESEEMEESFS